MTNHNLRLWKLIYNAINVFKDYIYSTQKKLMNDKLNKGILEKPRTDIIDLHDIFNKVKAMMKEKELEKQKEDSRRRIIENAPFV